MTREHKLALIVGFALVLVVGVLISDHLSGARRASMPEFAADTVHEEGDGVLVRRGPDLALASDPAAGRWEKEANPAEVAPGVAREAVAMREPEPTHSQIAGIFMNKVGDAVGDALNDLRQGRTPPAAAETTTRTLTMGAPVHEQSELLSEPDLPARDEQTNAPQGKSTLDPRTARRHNVQPGDSLWSICEQYYGDGHLHRELAEVNRDRLGSEGTLRVGATLLIPTRSQLTGRPSNEEVRGSSIDTPGTARKTSPPRTYTVKSGDTLSEISQKMLGTSRRWEEILKLNGDQLDEPSDLRVGMVLKLPAD